MTDDPVGFWAWAVSAYTAPGVSDACLALQDTAGQNVPLLLWAAWTAATGRPLADDVVEAACDAARAWEGVAIHPLRSVRRTLKKPVPDISDTGREALRQAVKAVELEAERHLMADLEALAASPSGPPGPILPALVAVSRAWSRQVPRSGLEALAERLPA